MAAMAAANKCETDRPLDNEPQRDAWQPLHNPQQWPRLCATSNRAVHMRLLTLASRTIRLARQSAGFKETAANAKLWHDNREHGPKQSISAVLITQRVHVAWHQMLQVQPPLKRPHAHVENLCQHKRTSNLNAPNTVLSLPAQLLNTHEADRQACIGCAPAQPCGCN